MRIGVLVRDRSGSARVRVLQHLPAWRRVGHEVRVVAWDAPANRAAVARRMGTVLALASWADVVVAQKPVLPAAGVRALAATNPRLVVDLDDAVWVGGRSRREEPARVQRTGTALASSAAVVVGSDHLATEVAARWPSAPPPRVLRPSLAVPATAPPPVVAERRPRVGWIGSAGNLTDLAVVAAPLERLAAAGVVDLVVITEAGAPIALRGARAVPWSEATETDLLVDLDVGVMPLADDPRSAGRCGFKALQYAAAGRPTVASSVGAAVEVVDHERSGLLADGDEAWEAALRRLATDADLRARLGAGAHALAASVADRTQVGEALLGILGDLARRPRWR